MRIQLPEPRRPHLAAPPPPPAPAPTPRRPHLPYVLNPCDIERARFLAPVGDAAAALFLRFIANTDCPCCLGFRLLALTLVAGALPLTVYLLAT